MNLREKNKTKIRIIISFFLIGLGYTIFSIFILKLDHEPIVPYLVTLGFLLISTITFYFLISSDLQRRNKFIEELDQSRSSYKELYQNFIRINQELNHKNQILIETNRKLAETDALKNTFLANMSHEIRTPLNSIIGFSELICNDILLQPKYKKYLLMIRQNGSQLLKIINDILDLSKIETDLIKINKKPLHINKFIDDSLIYIHELIGSNRRNIIVQFNKGLKNNSDLIETDEQRLHQIMNNLMDNAVKFTKSGKIVIGYHIDKNNDVEFYVYDTGKGIHPDKIKSIFEPFRQGEESRTRTYNGTGLGLPICKGLIALLDGEFRVESTIDVGSTFYFTIPRT